MATFVAVGLGAARAATVVTSVNAEELIGENLDVRVKKISVSRRGIMYVLSKNGKPVGGATIGIFSSSIRSRQALDERILNASVGPCENQDQTVGDRSAAWHRTLAFIRDNVLVNLDLLEGDPLHGAQAIDANLRDGNAWVRRGDKVEVPIVDGVEYGPAGWRATVRPAVPGDTAVCDWHGVATGLLNTAVEICFATKDGVMAEPLKCDGADLLSKMEAARTRERNERAPTPEARRQLVADATAILRDRALSPYHRNKAVVTLGTSGDESVIPILLAELEQADWVVRQNTIIALGRLHAKEAVPYLVAILERPVSGDVSDDANSDDEVIRRHAASALGDIGEPSAIATLKSVAGAAGEYPRVREAAARALKRL